MFDTTLDKLNGKTAFLNGEEGLDSEERKLFNKLKDLDKDVVQLDDLYNFPERLTQLTECDNIVLQSTGQRAVEIGRITKAFLKLNYVPKNVIFGSESAAFAFLDVARGIKKSHPETKFYFYLPGSVVYLTEINWI